MSVSHRRRGVVSRRGTELGIGRGGNAMDDKWMHVGAESEVAP